ncbi:MAG: hypothetical protein EXS31_11465 [Pedosphaera sp.]|nr:hypothetical protein [Pedosphaera sp.]
MNEETKRKMIRDYFKKSPNWSIVLIVIGGIFLLSGGQGIVVGLILIGVGGFAIYSSTTGKPTDQQMDEWLEEDLKTLTAKALNKTGTDATELVSESVQVTGPRFWNVGGAPILYKKGMDGTLRFTPMEVSVINFTQNQLLNYTCVLDRTTSNPLNESTDEYFYKDVVSVATKTDSKTYQMGKKLGAVQMNAAEFFTLRNAGGGEMSILLRDVKLIEKMGGGEIPTTRAEKAIQAVRKMLREKKAQ